MFAHLEFTVFQFPGCQGEPGCFGPAAPAVDCVGTGEVYVSVRWWGVEDDSVRRESWGMVIFYDAF